MAIHTLQRTQKLKTDIHTLWDFISSPKNLKEITPSEMSFELLSDLPEKMYAGQIIQYKVKPLFGISLNWCTEITYVKELDYFVDEQRKGPYKLWHHQHHLKEIEGGVEMIDIVHYEAPFSFLGDIATPFIVEPKLKEIFDFRFEKLKALFGEII